MRRKPLNRRIKPTKNKYAYSRPVKKQTRPKLNKSKPNINHSRNPKREIKKEKQQKEILDNTYMDQNGYPRTHSNLIHRQIAYKYIYLKNKDKYILPFHKYVVHHIDGNKKNYKVTNLEILTKEQHEIKHGIYGSQTFINVYEAEHKKQQEQKEYDKYITRTYEEELKKQQEQKEYDKYITKTYEEMLQLEDERKFQKILRRMKLHLKVKIFGNYFLEILEENFEKTKRKYDEYIENKKGLFETSFEEHKLFYFVGSAIVGILAYIYLLVPDLGLYFSIPLGIVSGIITMFLLYYLIILIHQAIYCLIYSILAILYFILKIMYALLFIISIPFSYILHLIKMMRRGIRGSVHEKKEVFSMKKKK